MISNSNVLLHQSVSVSENNPKSFTSSESVGVQKPAFDERVNGTLHALKPPIHADLITRTRADADMSFTSGVFYEKLLSGSKNCLDSHPNSETTQGGNRGVMWREVVETFAFKTKIFLEWSPDFLHILH